MIEYIPLVLSGILVGIQVSILVDIIRRHKYLQKLIEEQKPMQETREARIERLTEGFTRSAYALKLLTDKLGDDYLDILEGTGICGAAIYQWWGDSKENVDTFADLLVRRYVFLVITFDNKGLYVTLQKHIIKNSDIKERVKKVIDEHSWQCRIVEEQEEE